MSIFFKTAYLRVLLSTLPLGIILSYFGINGIIELPKENELAKHSGNIDTVEIKRIYYRYLKSFEKSYVIKIKGIDTAFLGKLYLYGDTLNKYLPNAKNITIWTYPQEGWKEIVKMEVDGRLIIKYKDDNPFLFVIVLIIGIIISIPSIYYLFKHPEDLFGTTKKTKLPRRD
jgi:hypothetical protein